MNTLQGNAIIKEFNDIKIMSVPNGRALTKAETERMWIHLSGNTWAMQADDEGRIYLGGNEEDNDDIIRVKHYVMINDIMRLPLIKNKVNKKNPILENLNWYNKLLKKIR